MKEKILTILLAGILSMGINAKAQSPYKMLDGSFISLKGEVASTTADSFLLDYGEGIVMVEMDDWDWYGDAYGILPEDNVTVYGYVDDDMFETTSIEASSVYVEDLNTFFYASGADEESAMITTAIYDFDFEVTGKITDIQGREFTLDTGTRKISVDTWQLGFNPLDKEGYLQLDKGDRVTVFGDLDNDLFDEQELSAESIIKIQKDKGKTEAQSS